MWSMIALLAAGLGLVIAARYLIGRWLGFESEEERAVRSATRTLMHMRDVDALSPETGPFAHRRWLRPKDHEESHRAVVRAS